MGSHEERSLTAIYNEPYDFSLSVHDDMNTFMNLHEFAAIHNIDGQKVLAVMTGRKHRRTDDDGVISIEKTLYIKNEYIKRAEPGMSVRIDGAVYIVENSHLIQGELWRIDLIVGDIT